MYFQDACVSQATTVAPLLLCTTPLGLDLIGKEYKKPKKLKPPLSFPLPLVFSFSLGVDERVNGKVYYRASKDRSDRARSGNPDTKIKLPKTNYRSARKLEQLTKVLKLFLERSVATTSNTVPCLYSVPRSFNFFTLTPSYSLPPFVILGFPTNAAPSVVIKSMCLVPAGRISGSSSVRSTSRSHQQILNSNGSGKWQIFSFLIVFFVRFIRISSRLIKVKFISFINVTYKINEILLNFLSKFRFVNNHRSNNYTCYVFLSFVYLFYSFSFRRILVPGSSRVSKKIRDYDHCDLYNKKN